MLAGSSRAVVDTLVAVAVVVDRVAVCSIHAVDSTHDADSEVAEGMDMAVGGMVSVNMAVDDMAAVDKVVVDMIVVNMGMGKDVVAVGRPSMLVAGREVVAPLDEWVGGGSTGCCTCSCGGGRCLLIAGSIWITNYQFWLSGSTILNCLGNCHFCKLL